MKDGFLARIQRFSKLPILTERDMELLFSDKASEQIHNSIAYHVKEGNLQKYRRGLYSLKNIHLSKFTISNYLYTPSYISFSSALSHYELIPEAVYETTAACVQVKKKVYKNTVGIFSFHHVPVIPFFLGVQKDESEKFLIASPLRALFDTIYSEKKKYQHLRELEEDLRIDLDELGLALSKESASDILKLASLYKKRNTLSFGHLLIGEFK